MPFQTFGDTAARWSAPVSIGVDAICCDAGTGLAALAAAVAARRKGRAFFASVFLDEPETALLQQAARSLWAHSSTPDARRANARSIARRELTINGRSFADYTDLNPAVGKTLSDFVRLSEGLLVRSWAEYERIRRLLGIEPQLVWTIVSEDPRVPQMAPGAAKRGSVVVWAPDQRPEELLAVVSALEQLRCPAIIVAASQHGNIGNIEFADVKDSQRMLADAAVIVDANFTDPGSALALARWSRPLVYPDNTGVIEYLDGGVPYRRWSAESLHSAIVTALGSSATISKRPSDPRGDLKWPPPAPTINPLVSIVICTLNRPVAFANALRSALGQTYGHIEIVVVNDAGPPVTDIVAGHPKVRIIDNPTRMGAMAATNVGIVHSNGEYVAFLDDDDEFFPDHIDRLVAAVEHSGAAVAHSQALTQYVDVLPDQRYRAYGYAIDVDQIANPSNMLSRNHLMAINMLIRRDLFERYGTFNPSIEGPGDYELWLRYIQHVDFVRSAAVTTLYSRPRDKSNLSGRNFTRYPEFFDRIYKMHPAPGQASIESDRRVMIGELDHNAKHAVVPAPPAELPEELRG